MHHFNVASGRWVGLVAAIAWPIAGWADERERAAGEPLGAEAPSLLDRLLGSPEAAQPANAVQADGGSGPEVAPALLLAPPPLAAEVEAAAKQVREAYGPDLQEIRDPVRRRELFDQLVEASADLAVAPSQRWATLDLALEIASQACEADSVREALDKRAILFADQDRLGPMLAFLKDVQAPGRANAIDSKLLEASLDLNKQALAAARQDAGRVSVAREAIEMAEKMLARVPVNDQDRLRRVVRTQREQTDEIAGICAGAAAARAVLATAPDDHEANATVGYAAAWAGDWGVAAAHLRRIKDAKLKAAAERETVAPQAATPEEVYALAAAWWDAVKEDPADAILAPRPLPRPTPQVQRAIRGHAADLYQRALPDLTNQVDRKLSQARIDEVLKGKQGQSADEREKNRLPVLMVASPDFDEPRFLAAEEQRSKLFRELGEAVKAGQARDVKRLRDELASVRVTWAESLHLQNRDATLPRKKELVTAVLTRNAIFADGWLCDCYLELLAGNLDQARTSLAEADRLMEADPQRQVFCGQQLLDAAQALLELGDIEGAKRLSNSLKKRFAQDEGVQYLEARIAIEQRLLSNADSILRKLAQDRNASPAVTAAYAWFKAANPVERLRNLKEADEAIQRTLNAKRGPLWKVLRAKAAVLAAENRWNEAINTLDQAFEFAPLVFAAEFESQRDDYVNRKLFFFAPVKR